MSDEPFLLKDHVFNPESITVLARAVHATHPPFQPDHFVGAVFDEDWGARALKERMRHVAECLRTGLPDDYATAVTILRKASPATADAGFAAMAFSDFVEAFGVDDYETSIPALEEFTSVVSAEFAVRPFLLRYPDRMIEQMLTWTGHPDERVRRLASEGSRPRLPWGMALKPFQEDPSPVLLILEQLRHDPSDDVRRSVANNLNDISRDHPGVVVETLTGWQDGTPEVAAITKHALRTLLKQGHPGALCLLGFDPDPEVRIEDLAIEPSVVELGAAASVRFDVISEADRSQLLMIDGVVEFARPQRPSTKVFKWMTVDLEAGGRVRVARNVSVKPLSTRRIYPGTHAIELQVNGARLERIEFEVIRT